MPEVQHLSRAPIREAVFDVRIPRQAATVMEALERLARSLPGFAPGHTQFEFEAGIELDAGGGVRRHERTEAIGFRVTSDDQLRVLQIRANGFSFSRLQPYTSWDQIRTEVEPLLERYIEAVGTREGERVALRYINHLRLPYPTMNVKDYLLGLPDLPDTWPGVVESFLYRATLGGPSGISVNVTHALVDDVEEDRIGVIFDIDAFRVARCAIGDESFWQTFLELRDLKNRIFFGGITTRTVEMYA